MISSVTSVLLLGLVGVTLAQMTFSDGWGKRSAPAGMHKRMLHPVNLHQDTMQEEDGKSFTFTPTSKMAVWLDLINAH